MTSSKQPKVDCDDGVSLTVEHINVDGLPVRATANLTSVTGGIIRVGMCGQVSPLHDFTRRFLFHDAVLSVIWKSLGGVTPGVYHSSLDNIVIHRH